MSVRKKERCTGGVSFIHGKYFAPGRILLNGCGDISLLAFTIRFYHLMLLGGQSQLKLYT